MMIRTATLTDLDQIHYIESKCFAPNEAATKEKLKQRLENYPNHFWLMFKGEKLIAFIDGFTTNSSDLTDEMFENATLHDEKGSWQMIFGLNTLPQYRKQGYASKLIKKVIETAKKEKRLGIVLTCKKELIPFYEKFGFVDEGLSSSTHGGEVWYQMRLRFHG